MLKYRKFFNNAFVFIFIFLFPIFPITVFAKEYTQPISDISSSYQVEFFIQTLGTGFEGDLDKVTIKITDIFGPLYPLNFQIKEWSKSNYSASAFVQKFDPCSYETTPQCGGTNCTSSGWSTGTDYTLELDFSCRGHVFDTTHYYALGLHGGNLGNKFRVLGSGTNNYLDGELKTGALNLNADCYYGSNNTWGGWVYNQISTQVSVCHEDGNVNDMFFELTPPIPPDTTPPDTTPPEVSYTLSPGLADGDNDWYVIQPEITLSSSDSDLNKIYYSWDNVSWSDYTGLLTSSGEGNKTLYYKADDTTGNVSNVYEISFKVDTVSPERPDNFKAKYEEDSGYIELTWDVDEEDVDRVLIYRSFDENFEGDSEKLIATNLGSDDTETYKSVKTGKKYYFKIYSVDNAGNTSKNEETSLKVPEVIVEEKSEEVQVSGYSIPETFVDTKEPVSKEPPLPKPTEREEVLEEPSPSPEVLGTEIEKAPTWLYWFGGFLFLTITTIFLLSMKKNMEE